MWIFAACVYLFSMLFAVQLDPRTGLHSWREAALFPGIGSMLLMLAALFPPLPEIVALQVFGVRLGPVGQRNLLIAFYLWGVVAMIGAWVARYVERLPGGRFFAGLMIYVFGYGSLLCAITVDSYVKEWRRADASWVKTEKVGRVLG